MRSNLLATDLMALLVSLVVLAPSSGSSAVHGDGQCFSLKRWTGRWKTTPAGQSIYLRLDTGSVLQLQLDGTHILLTNPFAVLRDRNAGTAICGPLDFHLTVSDGIGNTEALVVREMRLLTSQQAEALPGSLRP